MAKKAFGGMKIDFSKSTETLAEVFGKKPLGPGEMNAAIWKHIKAKELHRREG